MFTVAVANTKGGSGKSTLATHIAAWYAKRGFATTLGDLDIQQSSLNWLERRPAEATKIRGVDLAEGRKVLRSTQVLVVDCMAAMKQKVVRDVVKQADVIVIPVLPSAFDEDGARRFVEQLEELKPIRKNKRAVAFVGNRVRARTRAAQRLEAFLADLGFPTVTVLRDSTRYAQASASGLALVETAGRRDAAFMSDWEPLFEFLRDAAVESGALGHG